MRPWSPNTNPSEDGIQESESRGSSHGRGESSGEDVENDTSSSSSSPSQASDQEDSNAKFAMRHDRQHLAEATSSLLHSSTIDSTSPGKLSLQEFEKKFLHRESVSPPNTSRTLGACERLGISPKRLVFLYVRMSS